MKTGFLFLGIFLFFSVSCNQKNISQDLATGLKSDNNNGIIGGLEVTESDPITKYTVMIHSYQIEKDTDPKPAGFSLCTGVIIGKKSILTAAHCFENNSKSKMNVMEVYFARTSVNLKKAPKAYGTLISSHPYYNEKDLSRHFDLAIVTLESEVPAGYEPISILPNDVELKVGDLVFPAGYGRTQDLSVPVSPYADYRLNKSVGLKILEDWGTFFYIDQSKGSGVCSGDSGGPTFVQIKGKLYLVGITHGYSVDEGKSDSCKSHGMLIKVQTHKSWINTTMPKKN
ncbi:MAG: hypothetical protein B7Y39_10585 [Bdellovibrio sp. 28-41-41]|nr:MAG: hypothetical protein B7Y39_10585 [Bdellovibrio sp. 28-41-41]